MAVSASEQQATRRQAAKARQLTPACVLVFQQVGRPIMNVTHLCRSARGNTATRIIELAQWPLQFAQPIQVPDVASNTTPTGPQPDACRVGITRLARMWGGCR